MWVCRCVSQSHKPFVAEQCEQLNPDSSLLLFTIVLFSVWMPFSDISWYPSFCMNLVDIPTCNCTKHKLEHQYQRIPKETNPEYSLEGLMWSWSSNTLATWFKELTHWKRPWCWDVLEKTDAGGKGRNRWWDGWMVSMTQWTWVWANSKRQKRTEESGMLKSKELEMISWLNNNKPCRIFSLANYTQILSLCPDSATQEGKSFLDLGI